MDFIKQLKVFVRPDSKVCVDNNIFRICTKLTFMILGIMVVLVSSKQFFGEPIHCIVDEIPQKIIDSYCWFYSTYTLSNRMIGISGRDMLQPGVSSDSAGFNDTVKYHSYYQWVCFTLLFQAFCSYLPYYIWKSFENGRIKALSEELKQPFLEDEAKTKRKAALIFYVKENLNNHSYYAYRFYLCELLNCAIAIGQIYLTNLFLGGAFLNYGIDVMRQDAAEPMTRIFPKMTKCVFHKYGPSGSVQKFDGLCVLPVNVLNEKIYLFLWFWFFFISVLSILAVVYRALICSLPKLRYKLLRTRARLASPRDIQYILIRFNVGDWFMLYQLSKNIDALTFKEICRELSTELYSNNFTLK
ncbi:innexin inx2-like [Contarinia nasturtii]|uniref:innexin inx2-like n=1 Tax=Contarinia nasturtii TaxID=265458 RepID=UPI0012D4B4A4|nr:innexin inx2-like [Contarinia nasturtii]